MTIPETNERLEQAETKEGLHMFESEWGLVISEDVRGVMCLLEETTDDEDVLDSFIQLEWRQHDPAKEMTLHTDDESLGWPREGSDDSPWPWAKTQTVEAWIKEYGAGIVFEKIL